MSDDVPDHPGGRDQAGRGSRIRGAAAAVAAGAGLATAALSLELTTGPGTVGLAVAAAGVAWLAVEWRRQARRAVGAREEAAELREACRDLRRSRSELEEAYSELRFEQADLVNSARLATLGSLVAGIAHELGTPLGALHSDHETVQKALRRLQGILADERVDESELKEVRRIVQALDGVLETSDLAIGRMVSLVESLRMFGRPDGSERDRVDPHQALDDTVELVEHRLGKGVEVVKDYGDLPAVECYPAQLNQSFMNLLLNASQAVGEEGTIRIRTRGDEERVRVEVQDDGVGIPEDHLDRIFEPGFSTKGTRVGMGLGLLITRQVVERHHGEIRVESEEGEGTRFTLELPVRLPEEEGEERPGPGPAADGEARSGPAGGSRPDPGRTAT